MVLSLLITALIAASHTTATPVPAPPTTSSPERNYICHEFNVDIPVNDVSTVVPPLPEIESAEQATHYCNLITTRPGAQPMTAPNLTTLTNTFTINGQYCTPLEPGAKASTIHLLSHGLGFNASYWDLYDPSNLTSTAYSYVSAATSAGYSTLLYNRLGIFPSSVVNPYTEVQSTVELSILATLTNLTLNSPSTIHPSLPSSPTVIHVGHSWGSLLSKALAAVHPELTTHLVLTGYSDSYNYQNLFAAATSYHLANQNQPSRFPPQQYSNGFLTWPDQVANQYCFLGYPNFPTSLLEYAEATKYPFTLGEFESIGQIIVNATDFTGKVHYVPSQYDVPFCGGDCVGLVGVENPVTKAAFPNATITVDLVEGVGHGLNLHYQAEAAYQSIMAWVDENVE